MDYENVSGFSLINIAQKNLLLGKNGSGKSFFLRNIQSALKNFPTTGKVRYISPERAGMLNYEPSIDNAISNQANYLDNIRSNNQIGNFKEQSVALYRKLELLTLREIETEHTQVGYVPKTFQNVIDKINSLLDRIYIQRSDVGFAFLNRSNNQPASPQEISSGESEVVSLAIEFLSFLKECDKTRINFLLIDEPDVHLHPDLQDRLANFISTEIVTSYLTVIIASHSTSFIGTLSRDTTSRIAFMHHGDTRIEFKEITETIKDILPMFGAHPLSNIFNEAPILLVEGEDDERIWQQAVRSSIGRINVYPCVAGDIHSLNEYELQANTIITAVYDRAIGFSLRDRDEDVGEIDDVGVIRRMRLSCRAAENLLLSDDVLQKAGTTWENVQSLISAFIQESISHPYHTAMKNFRDNGLDRKGANLKEIRLILAGFISNKPWEVLVGQTIAGLQQQNVLRTEDSLLNYLGDKVVTEICKINLT